MLFDPPLVFTHHVGACAVDQKVQSRCCRVRADRLRKMLLTPTNGSEIRNLSTQASKLEQALRHANRLAQSLVEQALDRQAELNRHLVAFRAAPPPLALAVPCQHVLVHSDEQRATRLQRCIVVFSIGHSVVWFYWVAHATSLSRAHN